MRYSFIKITLLLLFIITPKVSWSDEPPADYLSSYRFTVGVSAYAGEFSVGPFSAFSDNTSPAFGTLTEDFSYTPYVSLGSPYKFLGETNFAVLMEYDFTSFSLNKQDVDGKDIDLGTSVSGYSAFVTPNITMSLMGRQPYGKYKQSLIIGSGLGLGYLRATGDIIYTETTLERKDINISSLAYALSVFGDYRIGNFVSRITLSMTGVPRGDIEYRYTGYALSIGYIFDL